MKDRNMTLQIDNYYTALYWHCTVLTGVPEFQKYWWSEIKLFYLPKIGGDHVHKRDITEAASRSLYSYTQDSNPEG